MSSFYYVRKFDQRNSWGGRQHRTLSVTSSTLLGCAAQACHSLGCSVLPADVEIVEWNEQAGKTVTVLASEMSDG